MFNHEISEKILKKLYFSDDLNDREIAEKYDISIGKVRYLRKKYHIQYNDKVVYRFLNSNSDNKKRMDEVSFIEINNPDYIDVYAKAITNYLFRSGPIEDMHSVGQLSQKDMKMLNKYTVNKAATLLDLVFKGEWLRIYSAFQFHKLFGSDWDPSEIDYDEFDLATCFLLER